MGLVLESLFLCSEFLFSKQLHAGRYYYTEIQVAYSTSYRELFSAMLCLYFACVFIRLISYHNHKSMNVIRAFLTTHVLEALV